MCKALHRGSKQQESSRPVITLLLLVHATYIYYYSSRTSRSWRITQSVQRHRRGSNTTNWVHLMANNSSRAFASDGKINTVLLNFRNANRLCLFCLMRLCLFCLTRLFCHMRQNKMYGFVWVDQDWFELMIFKNFADQDWIGFKFCGSGLDSD